MSNYQFVIATSICAAIGLNVFAKNYGAVAAFFSLLLVWMFDILIEAIRKK